MGMKIRCWVPWPEQNTEGAGIVPRVGRLLRKLVSRQPRHLSGIPGRRRQGRGVTAEDSFASSRLGEYPDEYGTGSRRG